MPMNSELFTFVCRELGHDPSTVQVVRLRPREASVTYTDSSGMPCGTAHRLEEDLEDAA
jgi:hypothetical protein